METYVHCTSGRRGVKPALRGWDTVTLWGELSATTGCVTDTQVSGVPPGATKRGRARRSEGFRGGTTHFPLLEPCAPLPSQLASPSGGQSPDVCSHGLPRSLKGPGGARCLRVGCSGEIRCSPPACRSNMVLSVLWRGAHRLGAGGEASLFGGGRGQPGRLIGRGSLPSPPALYVREGGPSGTVSNRSHPQSVLAHLMHGLLSYTKLKCGAIGPVLKHGPRSYTLSRVEGDGRAPHAQRKQVVEPAFRTCEGADESLSRGRGC